MPIDFRQIAAPSFSDSNTLVALAAKQQQEAMTGIQGAWTGAMDAIGNRVQGEMEGIANQASFSQLTDPTQRAALDQQIMAANTLGMGDVQDINKYTDARRGVQLGLLDTVNRVDRETQLEDERVGDKLVADSAWFLADRYNQIEAEEDKGKKTLLQQATDQDLKKYGLTDFQLSKATQLADQQNQKQRIANFEEQVKALGPEATAAQIAAVWQNINASKINTAIATDKHMNGGKGDALSSRRKYADSLGLQGAINDKGEVQYNVLMQKVTDTIAKSGQEQERVDPETMSYDQYLIKNSDLMDKKLGSFGRKTDVKGLQAHFKWAEDNGAPYPDREKILITEGFLTGSIKMNLFTENFFDGVLDGAGNQRIKEAIGNTHLPKVETEFNTKRMQSGQDAFGPLVDFFRSENVPPDQALTYLGITSTDHPQAKYLPENYRKVLEAMVTQPPPDGAPPLLSQAQKEAAQAERLSITDNLAKVTQGTTAGNTKTKPGGGVYDPTKTTQELPPVPKPVSNPVKATTTPVKPKAVTPKPTNYKSNNGYTYTSKTDYVVDNNTGMKMETVPVTAKMVKRLGVETNSKGDIVLPSKRSGERVTTVYGTQFKLSDAASYKTYLSIQNAPQAADKIAKGSAFINGTSSYKAPSSKISTPDLKHPLANLLSDDPNNFVPYNERNVDGSPKHISKVEKKKYGKFTYKDAYTKY